MAGEAHLMADIVLVRSKPGVRIYLHIQDIVDIAQQQDILMAMTTPEIEQLIEVFKAELSTRGEGP
jgi:hypothetical protein